MTDISLDFLAHQQARILNELADMRADMTVLLAITQRLDTTIAGLTNEMRALHVQLSRIRVRLSDEAS
jgi:hypothetical protein